MGDTLPLEKFIAITSARRVSELAALSCREPYLILHHDKVMLRPYPSFLPKVISGFHLNQDILFSHPHSAEEKQLHSLDVVRAVRVYLKRFARMRNSDAFFVLPEGPKKGQAASKASIGPMA